jgi:hypothetical protein
MRNRHHVSSHFCQTCSRWHSECDGCGWIWNGACTFTEALRHVRLHQLDTGYLESQQVLTGTIAA